MKGAAFLLPLVSAVGLLAGCSGAPAGTASDGEVPSAAPVGTGALRAAFGHQPAAVLLGLVAPAAVVGPGYQVRAEPGGADPDARDGLDVCGTAALLVGPRVARLEVDYVRAGSLLPLVSVELLRFPSGVAAAALGSLGRAVRRCPRRARWAGAGGALVLTGVQQLRLPGPAPEEVAVAGQLRTGPAAMPSAFVFRVVGDVLVGVYVTAVSPVSAARLALRLAGAVGRDRPAAVGRSVVGS